MGGPFLLVPRGGIVAAVIDIHIIEVLLAPNKICWLFHWYTCTKVRIPLDGSQMKFDTEVNAGKLLSHLRFIKIG